MSEILLAVLLVVLILAVVWVISARGGGAPAINLGTLQTILVILVLVFLVIWLGRMVLE